MALGAILAIFTAIIGYNYIERRSLGGGWLLILLNVSLLMIWAPYLIPHDIRYESEVLPLTPIEDNYVYPTAEGNYLVHYDSKLVELPISSTTLGFTASTEATITVKSPKFSFLLYEFGKKYSISVPQGSAVCERNIFCPEAGYYSE